MNHDFWHERWQNQQIGFHLPEANPLLVQHFSALNLEKNARIFLPLCGKTLDIAWLLAQGYRVAGAELSVIAIEDLFKSLHLTPNIRNLGEVMHYSTPNLDIYVGDIFKVNRDTLGKIDAIYDRAALVALPEDMRKVYTAHLVAMSKGAPQLLICFEYEQALHDGPPFSVIESEVKQHYQAHYQLYLLASVEVAGGLKGKCPATEYVWLLKPLN